MAKEEVIEMKGVVVEVLPDSRFRVTLDNGHNLVAYSAGKMRKHHIRIIAGDKVSLELSPYDRQQGTDHVPPYRWTRRPRPGRARSPLTGSNSAARAAPSAPRVDARMRESALPAPRG